MRLRNWLILALLLIRPLSAYSQGSRLDNSVFRPGTGVPGAKIAICQPLATTAASVAGNLATFTMSSNPQTAGFVTGMTILVSGFSGGDTFFNAGSLANGVISSGYTILSVTPTTIVVSLVHGAASAATNGVILQEGNSTNGCGALAALFTDASLSVSTPNPSTSDTLGNYGYGVAPGIYYTQIYGNGITTQLKQVVVPCIPITSCGGGATVIGGSGTAGQSVYFSGLNTIAGGTVSLEMAGIAGADLGAIMNNCVSQLSSGTGVCDGTNLPISGFYQINSTVNATTSVVFKFCGQALIQNAAINLSGTGAFLEGCSTAQTNLFKNANIDQVTLSGPHSGVDHMFLSGNKGSGFTGNGIVLASGSQQEQITFNTIDGEANDGIKDSGTGPGFINHNTIINWGVHGFESTGSNPESVFSENVVRGDSTSTGAAILNGGATALYHNFVSDGSGVVLVDASVGSTPYPIIGNVFIHTNGWPTLKTSSLPTTISSNLLIGGGTNGPVALGGGIWVGNTFNTRSTVSDGLDLTQNEASASDNTFLVTYTGVSNKCAINIVGDVLGIRTKNNQINISAGTANTNYGVCDTPSGGHNLGIVIEGDYIQGILSGGATVIGEWTNNAANVATNWDLLVEKVGCVHVTTCIKRTDTQNNKSEYINIQPGDTTLDNGTGSTNDVWIIQNQTLTFANLPTPAGNGSTVNSCSNCSQAKPTTNAGAGAFVVREAGQWNGL